MRARGLGLLAGLALLGCGRDPAPQPRPERPRASPSAVKFVAPIKPATSTPSPTAAPSAKPIGLATATATPPATASSTASSAPVKLASYPPKDECAALPGFAAFRTKLSAAVRKHDAEAVAALANPDVKLDFGGGAGREELQKRLGNRAELWGELQDALALGCAADDGIATMPWIFSRMPEDADAYRAMLVTGDTVPLRERAAANAPVRGELAWALVVPGTDKREAKARFVEVETSDKALRGFVEAAKLRSLLDYRVIAEQKDGVWAITAFIAGD